MEWVDFSGYTEVEKLEIASRYLIPRQERENGLREGELKVSEDGILSVVQEYTREAGVRQLEREVGKVARKVARRIAAGEIEKADLDRDGIHEVLGRPRVHPERMAAADAVGVATGMFYTPMGGDILFVEASVMPGKGGLTLTGQLGDVMKESGQAALSFAKANHARVGIDADAMRDKDIHVHVPAGAIPKDGPSAGITMATAMVSALSGRKVRRDIAMTGELTLTGRVLPIGGVKEKVLGAVRAGLREIILPKDNESHLDDLTDDVREMLTVHFVEDLEEVLDLVLRDGVAKPVRKKSGKSSSGKSKGGKKARPDESLNPVVEA